MKGQGAGVGSSVLPKDREESEPMSVIVTDEGFGRDDWAAPFLAPGDLATDAAGPDLAVDLAPEAAPDDLDGWLDRIDMIRVEFPSFSDGRGFSLASALRRAGYRGRLRARGHVIADQYAMARRSGFDEVEISDDLAARQPEEHWRARAGWRRPHYQSRLRG